MLKRTLFGIAMAAFVIADSVRAEHANRTSTLAITAQEHQPKAVKIPGTDHEIDFTANQPSGVHPSRSLIKGIKQWLAFNFDLRASYPDPIIQLAAPETLIPLRYQGFLSDWPRDITFPGQQLSNSFEEMISPHEREDLIAVYDEEMKTIYLPISWTGNNPAELSVLVHQMVHHLQGATPSKFECPQAREELAYAAQAAWLGLFGRNLENEFEIDPLTLAISTRCIY
jgi:hypothetical protein